ncbi:hypothetical protein MJO28_007001 [Puccinia striiformis f. sp. tritici]|uniref:SGNH hydrolase-type esterase domain-containing protein n=2 Tax=Puccinia striiformis f. sp. tritici TaxID=168172 RepID=A0A0L0UTT9_9BASI|nr:hypothetical protein Pst134EA_013106 [Puccinia striiformis f. sp. tritici]KNE90154.1 hypothetical protein PSTG_16377 [Puccinia striiformis f. sp. tritici PST-78]KAH9453988.1 hypothetical protein Pst134EB_014089 [Puccinia striiformis f. sp. tritici]KAH9465212.1 hypothetical protein Pst134EA_013106 [Puccinia striiformis f. sp. tritici]KAI7951317.1 hypothetical protein MJO28_007001 [Puccinia striiformis f. sp. tritici]KAI7955559.1 hypothetical protein MJO29_006958 [Puccinia striiformis f. sp. 
MVTVRDTHSEMTGPKCEPFSMDQLVMFGDSITQFAWQAGGMGSELANYYQRRLDVVNRGFSGYNTTWALHVAKTIFPAHGTQPLPRKRIVTIWFGANDAVIPPKPQMVTPENFVKNMIELIEIVQKHASPSGGQQDGSQLLIVLITPPPISIALRAADLTSRFPDWRPQDMDREPGRTRLFAELVCQVAQEKGLPVIDTWTAITKAADNSQGGLSTYLVDGLHLTPAGYAIVTTEFKSIVARHYPTFLPESLPHDFPWWAEIDVEHPENSFPSPC